MVDLQHPCPCCGHRTLPAAGAYDLCPVCFWEDDPNQLHHPRSADGANGKSLIEAQQAYLRIAAIDEIFSARVRPARDRELLDDGWYPIAPEQDPDTEDAHPDRPIGDYTDLYWWGRRS
ncbi:MAG TPA: CPCC family cysteine-rich protein [Microlunatus sp.]